MFPVKPAKVVTVGVYAEPGPGLGQLSSAPPIVPAFVGLYVPVAFKPLVTIAAAAASLKV